MRSIKIRRLTSLLLGLVSMALAAGEATAQFSDNPRLPTPQGNFVQGDQPCPCQDGHWYDKNRKSCVTGSCKVPGMPNGDKGGKYFAWDGNLFIDTPCKPCERLALPLATGTAAWVFADGPVASMKGKPPVVHTHIPGGWGSLPGSSWVTASTSLAAPEGNYTYELRFCLCPGFSNASLAMSVLVDNSATIFLNGNQIGAISDPNGKGFVNPPRPVNTSTQSFFLPGPNVLTVRVNNAGSQTGFLAGGQISADAGRCQ